MAEQKKFNTDIAILKFLFSLVIVWYHFQRVSPHYPYLLPKGYLCVELFLLISGYFMASSIVRNQAKGIEQNAFEFTLHKIKFIYPHLFVAFIISFILQNIFLIDMPLKDFFTLGIFSLGELSFIQIVGLKTSTHLLYNAQIWYVNAMIVAIFFLYPFVMRNVTKYGCYWGVLLPLFLYSYYITISQDILGRVYPWFRFATGGIILALSGLSLGISLYVASEAIKKKYDITKLGNILLRLIAFLTLALLFIFIKTEYFSQFKVVTDLNFVAYSFICLLLILITETTTKYRKYKSC